MNVKFVDTTLRDGHQSLWALGMRYGMMDAVAAELDQAGFAAVEVPAAVSYLKKAVRDLKEDPWATLRLLARKLPNTEKTAMGGGWLRDWEPPPPWLMRFYYERLVDMGALNRIQVTANTTGQLELMFPWVIPLLKELGLKIVVSMSYTISPRHTDEYYADLTRKVLAYKPDGIYLKDQGGLLTPDRIRTLIPTLVENAQGVPLELHSHCTTGLAPLCYLEAVDLGVQVLHTAVPPLANGSSQPSIFNVASNLRLMGHTPDIDEAVLRPVSERLTAIARRDGLPLGAPLEYDRAQYIHQVPGGVISNLKHQLAELRLQDRLDAVLEEVVQVRKELGYPIMITPHSQFVVTQAAINVAVGERYKVVTDAVIKLALGVYGEDSGYHWMDPNIKDRILSQPRARELAQAQPAHESMAEMRRQLGGPGVSDEELLLRYFMKGDAEIKAMRAAGPPRRYTDDGTPLLTLVEELGKHPELRQLRIEKGSASVFIVRRAAD